MAAGVVVLLLVSLQGMSYGMTSFRAAVFEHEFLQPERSVVVTRNQALTNIEHNLLEFERQAALAAQENVNIIVFPEDGIYGVGFKRDTITPYMEIIPDPRKVTWTPCDVTNVTNIEVQRRLSCMAKENSMYVVANYGDKQPCSPESSPGCPTDGRFQYNTNIVFAPNGTLVARYHKINLFLSEMKVYNVPSGEGNVIFETPFGKFGVFTCFDILFDDPARSLILDDGVGNIVFPTAWMDALPLLAAVQFHSAFAMGMGVNFLASNLHYPERRFQGSGIYTPGGAVSYYYNRTFGGGGGKLLIADVPVNEKPTIQTKLPSFEVAKNTRHEFQSKLFEDLFNFVTVSDPQSELTVCHNDLCCQLRYTADLDGTDLYAFGAFDGLHTYEGQYYLQICTLVKCANMSKASCGVPTYDAVSTFSEIEISGSFATPYIFPEVLMSENGSLTLAQSQLIFVNKKLSLKSSLEDPLLSASLFARQYELDGGEDVSRAGHAPQNTACLTSMLACVAMWYVML